MARLREKSAVWLNYLIKQRILAASMMNQPPIWRYPIQMTRYSLLDYHRPAATDSLLSSQFSVIFLFMYRP